MSYTNVLRILCVLASVFGAALVSVAPVLSQTPYYAGKTIAIIRGGGPGGSGEFQSRALMPYLQKYIPGNPTIVMEYMPGAGGRKAANYFYTTKPDGLKIASAGAMIPGPILGLPGSNYDIDKFPYIGSTETGNPYILFPAKRRGLIPSIKFVALRHCAWELTQWDTRFM
jgi:tripartite-type tricarboxylate transporter receptor subunit TctC